MVKEFSLKHLLIYSFIFNISIGYHLNFLMSSKELLSSIYGFVMIVVSSLGLFLMFKGLKIYFSRNYKRITEETRSQD